MPVYVWKGRTLAGESQAGEIEVARPEEAMEILRKKRVFVTAIKPKGAGFALPKFGGGSGVSTKDLAIFTRQFAAMISAGLPLVQCLDILSKQASKPSFGRIISDVTREVEAGATLSDALGHHRAVFDDLFRDMVAAGEAGGVLNEILMRLATYVEKADALKRKVQSAMVYPAVVLTVAMGATTFMLLFIIPTFAKMFTDFGGDLPLPTKIVLILSDGLQHFWWVGLLGLAAGAVAFKRYYSTEAGHRNIDALTLRIPALGDVMLKGSVARFTRTLGTLIASGVPILAGLEITARTAGNKIISEAIMTARASIREGETVSAPLKAAGVFPPMVVQMISVGEQTGALDEMLTKIAVFYEAEVDTAVDTLTSIIEPVMIVVMGGIVGGMVVAMYLPMFKLITVVAGKVDMSVETTHAARGRSAPHVPDAWSGLRTLIRARLIVTVLALPVGLLLAPGVGGTSWKVLIGAFAAVGVLSALYQLGVRIGRGLAAQTAVQLAGDLALVTVLASVSGGRGSQFALFFGVIVVTGGLLGRVAGGMLTAAGAAFGFVLLPWVGTVFALPGAAAGLEPATPLFATVAYLCVLGVLAGMLGERVHLTRADLERTARELDRVRVDNDTVLRHLTTGVLSVDAQGRVSYLNPAAEQVLGVRALECRGRQVVGAFPERLAPLRDLLGVTLDSRTPRARAELDLTGPSGQPLPIGLSTNLLLHEGRFTGLVAVFQDLSEVREMERRARRHETLAEIGALSARIAHELRNGLNPISGSVECLQRELKLEGENAVLMELISRECARLNRFVTDLLNYSRERDLALESLSVDVELADLGELLSRHPKRPDGVVVAVEAGACEACVKGDREQLRQVWLNLAVNAFDAMAAGGRLVVRQRLADGERVVVEFEDTGTGIAAEDLPRVGQPFYTTKQGGTGLGLTIASRIVERHGGTLTLESAPGRGTTVRVGLPVDEAVFARAA